MNREGNGTFYKLNWDNEFSVRFSFPENQVVLQHIPNNIFSVELPEIVAFDVGEDELSGLLQITLRSTSDGSVEREVFDVLLRNNFDIDISLSNSNKATWKYNGCSVEKIAFSPLIDRKSKANPFNFTLFIKVPQIIYNGDNSIIEFGKKPADLIIPAETTNKGE